MQMKLLKLTLDAQSPDHSQSASLFAAIAVLLHPATSKCSKHVTIASFHLNLYCLVNFLLLIVWHCLLLAGRCVQGVREGDITWSLASPEGWGYPGRGGSQPRVTWHAFWCGGGIWSTTSVTCFSGKLGLQGFFLFFSFPPQLLCVKLIEAKGLGEVRSWIHSTWHL